MPELHRKFADNSIRGQTNYEDMVKYFAAVRSKVEREEQENQIEGEKGPGMQFYRHFGLRAKILGNFLGMQHGLPMSSWEAIFGQFPKSY